MEGFVYSIQGQERKDGYILRKDKKGRTCILYTRRLRSPQGQGRNSFYILHKDRRATTSIFSTSLFSTRPGLENFYFLHKDKDFYSVFLS